MAGFTQFYQRGTPRRPAISNPNANNSNGGSRSHRAMTAPTLSSAAAATFTLSDDVPPAKTVSKYVLYNKPLPEIPKFDMTHTEVATGPEDDPATAEFGGNVKVNDDVPSKIALEKAATLPVLDADGDKTSFRSLHEGPNGEKKGQRVMIIFIRHFFCGNCQEYLRTLSASLPSPEDLLKLPTPTSIAIIGCGSPTLIPMYTEATSCPFPIYADPTKRLYAVLGMARTLSLGNTDPAYIHHTIVSGALKSIAQGLGRMGKGDVFKAGDMRQVGGEFVFENGKVTWCHRMRNTRDHAEAPVMRKVLGLSVSSPERPLPKRRWTTTITRRLSLADRRPGLGAHRRRGSHRSPTSTHGRNLTLMGTVEQRPVKKTSMDNKNHGRQGGSGSGHSLGSIVSGELMVKEPETL